MAWLEVTVSTAPGGIEKVAERLTAGGFEDLVIEDQAEYEDFLEQNRACWDYIDETLAQKLQGLSCIRLYLQSSDTAGMDALKALLDNLRLEDPTGSMGTLALSVKPLPDTDWEESWKENYPPQWIGENLVVLPYWLADTDCNGRKKIILDPGLTFGTGAHPSTRMVMAAMERIVRPGDRCIDLGSGSGILSITALRLGATSAIGMDIDPKAEDIARENAAYNGFSAPEFTALTGNVTEDRATMLQLSAQPYDVVLVNIVADVIIGLSPILPHFLGENSVLICSGILDTRLNDVLCALRAADLEVTEICESQEWRCVVAKRR